jgi:predicted nucleic acid-binding protein
MPNEVIRHCWDTCIVLDALSKNATSPEYKAVEPLLFEARAMRVRLAISTVTIAEIHYLKGFSEEESDRLTQGFLDHPFVDPWHVDDQVAIEARHIRKACEAKFGKNCNIHIPDALIVATACAAKATILFTRDGIGSNNRTPMLALDGMFGDPRVRIVTPIKYQQELDAIELEKKLKREADAAAEKAARAQAIADKTPLFPKALDNEQSATPAVKVDAKPSQSLPSSSEAPVGVKAVTGPASGDGPPAKEAEKPA